MPAADYSPGTALSATQARSLALRAQGFGATRVTGLSARRPIGVLDHLGVLQLDSVSVLARPQDLVPASRIGPYSVQQMHQSVYAGRRGFEYWGHAASWLPMEDYRYYGFRRSHLRRTWLEPAERLRDVARHVLERIRAEGPLPASSFGPEAGAGETRGVWWDWKPAKDALERLFAAGEVMCARRNAGFARLYELPERVLPPGLDVSDPGVEASVRYLLRKAAGALGVATGAEASDYFRLRGAPWRQALRDLVDAREVVRVAVDGWKEPGYALPAALEGPLSVPAHRPALLSPFDNLIWHRDRVERVFGFHYRISIYTPRAARTHGYYVLPLLVRGHLGGRADLKIDRKQARLIVNGLWLEGPHAATPDEADSALHDLARHLGAREVVHQAGEGTPLKQPAPAP